MRRQRPVVTLAVPATDGGAIAEVYREGEVLDRRANGAHLWLTVRLTAESAARLTSRPGVHVVAGAVP